MIKDTSGRAASLDARPTRRAQRATALDDTTPDGRAAPDSSLRDELAIERTRLAIERTVLAHVRTGLAFAAAGISVPYLVDDPFVVSISRIVTGLGAIGIAVGIGRFIYASRRINALTDDRAR